MSAASRTYDTDSITARNLFFRNPQTNVPISSYLQPVIPNSSNGLLQWVSPDAWAQSTVISSLGGASVFSLLGAANPTAISSIIGETISTGGYATVSYVNSRLFFYTTTLALNGVIQNYFSGGFPGQPNVTGYRTFTSSYTLAGGSFSGSGTGVTTNTISPFINLTPYRSLIDNNSRVKFEFQAHTTISTSLTTQAVTVSSFLTDGTVIIGDPIVHRFADGARPREFTSFKWSLTNAQAKLSTFATSLSFVQRVIPVDGSATVYIESVVPTKNGFFFTLDNSYNGVRIPY